MKLVFATNNLHKLKEACTILGTRHTILSLDDISCSEELAEDFETLEENARQKAFYVHRNYSVDCFADDTGLEVDALHGSPGVYSARYAGEQRDPSANMNKLLAEMEAVTNRKARFRTVICLFINGVEECFEGIVEGKISLQPVGDKGFGYDPVFVPEGFTCSFAQMEEEEKNKISHRGYALEKMAAFLQGLKSGA